VVEVVGRETVTEKITELVQAEQSKESENGKRQLESLVGQGVLVKGVSVSKKSVIVGREMDKEGKVIHPGRFQLVFEEIAPAFQEKLLDKTAGFTLELPERGTLEIQEVWDFAPPQLVSEQTEQAVAQAEPQTSNVASAQAS
jgi:hypothetical protein